MMDREKADQLPSCQVEPNHHLEIPNLLSSLHLTASHKHLPFFTSLYSMHYSNPAAILDHPFFSSVNIPWNHSLSHFISRFQENTGDILWFLMILTNQYWLLLILFHSHFFFPLLSDWYAWQGDAERRQGITPIAMMDREKKDELPQLEVFLCLIACGVDLIFSLAANLHSQFLHFLCGISFKFHPISDVVIWVCPEEQCKFLAIYPYILSEFISLEWNTCTIHANGSQIYLIDQFLTNKIRMSVECVS